MTKEPPKEGLDPELYKNLGMCASFTVATDAIKSFREYDESASQEHLNVNSAWQLHYQQTIAEAEKAIQRSIEFKKTYAEEQRTDRVIESNEAGSIQQISVLKKVGESIILETRRQGVTSTKQFTTNFWLTLVSITLIVLTIAVTFLGLYWQRTDRTQEQILKTLQSIDQRLQSVNQRRTLSSEKDGPYESKQRADKKN